MIIQWKCERKGSRSLGVDIHQRLLLSLSKTDSFVCSYDAVKNRRLYVARASKASDVSGIDMWNIVLKNHPTSRHKRFCYHRSGLTQLFWSVVEASKARKAKPSQWTVKKSSLQNRLRRLVMSSAQTKKKANAVLPQFGIGNRCWQNRSKTLLLRRITECIQTSYRNLI